MNAPETASRGWRILRRLIVGAAVFATLVAIFYSEEDWRGKRDWENCKRDLEAKGYVMDWQKLVPPPVPDESNFFTASPEIEKIFIKFRNQPSTNSQAASHPFWPDKMAFPELDPAKTGPIIVANLTVVPAESAISESVSNVHVLKINDPAARSETGKLIRTTLGEMAEGAQNFNFSAVQLDKLTPIQILVRADTLPSIGDLENLMSVDTITNIGHLRIE